MHSLHLELSLPLPVATDLRERGHSTPIQP
jgi:hypothetical protein